jgi:hypothetical protein
MAITRYSRTKEYASIIDIEHSEYWFKSVYKLIQNTQFRFNYHIGYILQSPNLRMEVLNKYKHLFPDLSNISHNPNLTIEFIKENIDNYEWDWDAISEHKNMTMDIIKQNFGLPWDTDGMSRNPNLTVNFIKEHPHLNWNYTSIMLNDGITFTDVINNPDLPFVLKWLPCKNIPVEYIATNPNPEWDWYHLTKWKSISDIIKNPNITWNYVAVSQKKGIPIDFIIANLEKFKPLDLCMYNISKNALFEDIINHPELPWCFEGISSNPNITEEFIIANFEKFTRYYLELLSQNTALTINIIRKYKDKLNWREITRNAKFTQLDIENNPDLLWHDPFLNPNVTEEFLAKYIVNQEGNCNQYSNVTQTDKRYKRLSFDFIIKNNLYLLADRIIDYKCVSNEFIIKKARQYLAAYKIQQWYIKCITDINYLQCRKKIAKDYEYYSSNI